MVVHVHPRLGNTLEQAVVKNVAATVAATEEERIAMVRSVLIILVSTTQGTLGVMIVVAGTKTVAAEVMIDMDADTRTAVVMTSHAAVVEVEVEGVTMMDVVEGAMMTVVPQADTMRRVVVLVLGDATRSVDTRNVAERLDHCLVQKPHCLHCCTAFGTYVCSSFTHSVSVGINVRSSCKASVWENV